LYCNPNFKTTGGNVKRFNAICATLFLVIPSFARPAVAQPAYLAHPIPRLTNAEPKMSCQELGKSARLDDATIVSAQVVTGPGGSESCKVTVDVRPAEERNSVRVWVDLPLKNWSGRLLSFAGGGFLGGTPGGFMTSAASAAAAGFVVASTDAGHAFDPKTDPMSVVFDGSFALDRDGRLNWDAVRNFAHLGVHKMTVVAKTLANDFYGTSPKFSYFRGCSTGGRQGQSEVQRYPGDYDGVLSGAPAVNWTHFVPAGMWPKAVMNENHHIVAQCKLEEARKFAIESCDQLDGTTDGIIARPDLCKPDTRKLIGKPSACGTIDEQDAEIIKQIWNGPSRRDGTRLWYGVPLGASFASHAGGDPRVPNSYDGSPNPIFMSWFKYFLAQNPEWSPKDLGRAGFENLYRQSVEQYGDVFETASADLHAFSARGGKTIIYHGLTDDNFPAGGTMQYVDAIRAKMGAQNTDSFLRLYLFPGMDHCAGGAGPQPAMLLDTLIDWVENGKAPGTITGQVRDANQKITRLWSLVPYRGSPGQILGMPVADTATKKH
jgi:feruloyl esterase